LFLFLAKILSSLLLDTFLVYVIFVNFDFLTAEEQRKETDEPAPEKEQK